jgi:hypothetical protein
MLERRRERFKVQSKQIVPVAGVKYCQTDRLTSLVSMLTFMVLDLSGTADM